jgi:hypothetical protein
VFDSVLEDETKVRDVRKSVLDIEP